MSKYFVIFTIIKFIIVMICIKTAKRFCREYWNIENYQQAVNDDLQTWHCHHRLETDAEKSRQQLIDEGLYYDCNPEELIFLTSYEHHRLHKHSDATKQKISESMKGEHNQNAGRPKKPVMCVETGEVFESLHSAARKYNLFYNNIGRCCDGKRKSCGKLHWNWI